jgi:hypothetical protein
MGYCFRRFDVGGFDNQGRKERMQLACHEREPTAYGGQPA